MPKEQHIKVEVGLPAWLVKRAASAGCQTRRVLEDELGREAFTRLMREAKK